MIASKNDLTKKVLNLPFRFARWVLRVETYLRNRALAKKNYSPLSKLVPLRQRLWAMRHGFYPEKVLLYGLENDNIKKFMPDYFYKSLHPINGRFSWMIDSKLNLPFLLKNFPEHAPVYYYLINASEMFDLYGNGRDTGAYDPGKLLSFIKLNGKFIIKPLTEFGGKGVFKIEANEGSFCINGNQCNERDVVSILASNDCFIVCKFEHQHQYADDLYPLTTNTVRIVTMRDYKRHKAFVGHCHHKVGTRKSIPVDNVLKGGLLCEIDAESGIIGRVVFRNAESGIRFIDRHPDTDVPITGKVIHNWNYVKSEVLRIADQLPFLPYMGWDIVITDNGFKALEINSLPGIGWQVFYPMSDKPKEKEFYRQIALKKGLNDRWIHPSIHEM